MSAVAPSATVAWQTMTEEVVVIIVEKLIAQTVFHVQAAMCVPRRYARDVGKLKRVMNVGMLVVKTVRMFVMSVIGISVGRVVFQNVGVRVMAATSHIVRIVTMAKNITLRIARNVTRSIALNANWMK